jgi:cytochrome c553
MLKPVFTTTICLIIILVELRIGDAGNLASGKMKSQACGKCHGIEGKNKNPAIPDLAGQPQYYLYKQLNEFKNGRRKDPSMNGISAALNESDMDDLAAYFASQRPPEVKGESPLAAKGKISYNLCVSCHGATASGYENVPRLAGQQVAYSITQLKAYRGGTRRDSLMNEVSQSLTDDEIKLLAEYTFYLR